MSQTIEHPTDTDIIFGGSRAVRSHPGNEQLTILVKKHLFVYQRATKKTRSTIISKIIQYIQRNNNNNNNNCWCRFLQKYPSVNHKQKKSYFILPDQRVVSDPSHLIAVLFFT
jgi:hypothetical protein